MIEVPPASFQTTPYGEVDSVALERLRANFDTTRLLQLVGRLDACLAGLGGINDTSNRSDCATTTWWPRR